MVHAAHGDDARGRHAVDLLVIVERLGGVCEGSDDDHALLPAVLVEAQASPDPPAVVEAGEVDAHDTRGGIAREADVDALVAVRDIPFVDGFRQ